MSFPIPDGEVLLDGMWVSPEAATIPLSDPAVQSGLGVFETIAVRGGRTVDAEEHVLRLARSASHLAVALPPQDVLLGYLSHVAARVAGGYGWMKVIAVRPGRVVTFGGAMDPAEEGRSVCAVLLPWRRASHGALTGLKTINYAEFALGLEEARRRGADEGLWLDTRGFLLEGCASNVFVVKGRRVFTPALRDGILPGVTRGRAIQAIRSLGLTFHEGKVRLPRLLAADEAFLTSSLRAVRPLVRFEGKPVGKGEPGPVTRAIAEQVALLRERPTGVTP